MNFFKKSQRKRSKVSLILLDWSVRESFHLFHYLRQQTVEREDYEVIIIEYYHRRYAGIDHFTDQVDTWVALEMPEQCYYHKHLMYNVGIVLANSPVIMIGDSDAMVRPTFLETIIRQFERDPHVVYHMDQFRNMRRDLYPFCFPSFEEVLGNGCINNVNGQTAGILNEEDPLHSRNYGACMCARRDHLIAIGGADEHIDYLGHICGPYDMTFRLTNKGNREVWESEEFLYHTWHPGQAGADNYLGPHDGRHMSTTALEALESGRMVPLLENQAIRSLRTGQCHTADEVLEQLIDPRFLEEWDMERITEQGVIKRWNSYKRSLGLHHGFRLVAEVDRVLTYPITDREATLRPEQGRSAPFEGGDVEEVRALLDRAVPRSLRWLMNQYALLDQASLQTFNGLAQQLGEGMHALPFPLKLLVLMIVGLLHGLARPTTLGQRIRQARAQCEPEAQRLVAWAMTLRHLFTYDAQRVSPENLVVLLERDNPRRALHLARWLGLIPSCRLFAAPSETLSDITALLDHIAADEKIRHLLVPTAFYHRHHTRISAHGVAKRIILI